MLPKPRFVAACSIAREVDIPITAGEGYRGLKQFGECIKQESYDILQPEGAGSGGILVCALVQGDSAVAFRVIGAPGKQVPHANSMDRRTGAMAPRPGWSPEGCAGPASFGGFGIGPNR